MLNISFYLACVKYSMLLISVVGIVTVLVCDVYLILKLRHAAPTGWPKKVSHYD